MLMQFPPGASEPPEDVLTAFVELEELRNELEFVRDNPPDIDEPDAFACAPLRPPPYLNSGVVELREPSASES
jgi:hypothetical protein